MPPVRTAGAVKPAPKKADGEICPECWPKGWPGADVAASCSHGEWRR